MNVIRNLEFRDALIKRRNRARATAEKKGRMGECILCGLCAKVCGYIGPSALSMEKGEDKKMHVSPAVERCVGCGACAAICPTGYVTLEEGEGKRVVQPWGAEVKMKDWDVVLAIFKYLLREGIVDCVLVPIKGEEGDVRPGIVWREKELQRAAGTRFDTPGIFSPLTDIRQLKEAGVERIAIVGTPCQIYALRKTQAIHNSRNLLAPHNLVTFTVGLFCTFNVGAECCLVCPEFVSPYADISIGIPGAVADHPVVVLHTDKGREIYQAVVEKGLVEDYPVREDVKQRVKEISAIKEKTVSA